MSNITELKNTGLKATLPRLKILEIFQAGKQRHMTAEDVFRVLLEDRSDVGLATVYRVLTQFEQAGLLNRSNTCRGAAGRAPAANFSSSIEPPKCRLCQRIDRALSLS